jgi:phenol 2-monooxygenase
VVGCWQSWLDQRCEQVLPAGLLLGVTDFPDIRTKCAIQSGSGGSILLIPREGGHLFRMYVDLGEVDPNDNGAVRNNTIEEIIAKANVILPLHPGSA